MARTGRPGISAEQKIELWQRWKADETLSDIGRALGKHAGSIFGVLIAKGGIAPTIRSRRAGSLSMAEREEIARGLPAGSSFRQLARDLGRSPSTISREVARNGGRRQYRPSRAEDRASQQALRPKPCRLATDPALCDIVADRLEDRWSPQQVSGWLKATYPGRSEMQLSHETIYRSLKDATVKRFHYDSHDQLRTHLADFMAAYNFARRLKTLGGLTPYEYICKIWTSEPERFILNPIHQMPGLNT